MSEHEQLVELAGALAGLMREHGELVSLTGSAMRILDAWSSPRYTPSARERQLAQQVCAEVALWASAGPQRNRQRRAQEALDRYVGRARRLG